MSKVLQDKESLASPGNALKGRDQAIVSELRKHWVLKQSCLPPFPEAYEQAIFGLGCFWGAERAFWQVAGVFTTMVGYAGGFTPNPTYHEVCSGRTGHTEVVRVIYDPSKVSYNDLLSVFWESHDPTQGFRQGNDRGSQYRSLIIATSSQQAKQAEVSQQGFQKLLSQGGFNKITTEIYLPDHAREEQLVFYYAETEHQQYLAKNPSGYCGLGGLGIACPPTA